MNCNSSTVATRIGHSVRKEGGMGRKESRRLTSSSNTLVRHVDVRICRELRIPSYVEICHKRGADKETM